MPPPCCSGFPQHADRRVQRTRAISWSWPGHGRLTLLSIKYGVLKKCVKAFLRELEELGLDPDTLRQLLAAETTPARGSLPLAKYNLHGTLCSWCVFALWMFRRHRYSGAQ